MRPLLLTCAPKLAVFFPPAGVVCPTGQASPDGRLPTVRFRDQTSGELPFVLQATAKAAKLTANILKAALNVGVGSVNRVEWFRV